MDLRAVILAGGQGTRLRSVFAGPKALVPIAGTPFIVRQLRWLASQGVRDVTLCLGYRAEEIIDALVPIEGLRIRWVIEETPLGTGGALKQLASYLDAPFILLNGDTWIDISISDLVKAHRAANVLGTFVIDAQGTFAGISVWESCLVQELPNGYSSWEKVPYFAMHSSQYPFHGFWCDIGTPAGHARLTEHFAAVSV